MSSQPSNLFDRITWRDPVSGRSLEPIVEARTPAGVPLVGALRIEGTDAGYPIVDAVARLTPELARRHERWLRALGLEPPPSTDAEAGFQPEETVASFGFQWTWNSAMRSEADLVWRVANRFKMSAADFADRTVLDAGAGAGDQSAWLLRQGASVVSVDLSSAIDVVARKLRDFPGWVGVQGDLAALPIASQQVDVVYCEGVIMHTQDSGATVRELCRVTKNGGTVLATHYADPASLRARAKHAFVGWLRSRLSRLERYRLLLITGNLAALGHLPGVGVLARKSGVATHSNVMPEFKTTWTNTFDTYGDHAYQRHVSAAEFWKYFEAAANVQRICGADGVLAVRVHSATDAPR